MFRYDVKNWYWIVDGSTEQVYSSADATYVSVSDSVYGAWLAEGNYPSRINSEEDLQVVFADQYPAGWASVSLKAEASAALQKSDVTMVRIQEAIALGLNTATSSDVVAWINYRRTLRAIVGGVNEAIPSMPPFPSGT